MTRRVAAPVVALFVALAGLGANIALPRPALALTLAATNDSYSVVHDRTLSVPAPGVLGNDVGLLGSSTAVLDSQPARGTLTFRADGSFTYVPSGGYVGTDSFQYHAHDVVLLLPTNSLPATVTITVTNAVPVAANDAYAATTAVQLTVAPPGVMRNDSDADGDALTASLVSAGGNGSLSFAANGGFTYKSGGSFSGTVSFTYRVSDGMASSNVATVTITVSAPPATPTPAPTPTPTPAPTPTPTLPLPTPTLPLPTPTLPLPTPTLPLPTPTLPLPTPTLPLPTLPLPTPTLPLPTLPLPTPTLPLPTLPVPTPSLPLVTPTPSPTPRATLDPSASPTSSASASPTASFAPNPSDGGTPGGGSPGTGGGFGQGGDGPFGIGAVDVGPTFELGDAGFGGFGGIDWAVPALALTVPGLLLILAILAQTVVGVVWLPFVRRWLGAFGVRRRKAEARDAA
jgi:Big-like domain-containing protein